MKTCSGCGEAKPLEAFTKDKRCPDGRIARCKGCWNAASRKRYHRDVERNRQQKRNYRAANLEATREKNRKASQRWRKANPELARQKATEANRKLRAKDPDYFRNYYRENIETERTRSRERMRRWREGNPQAERETRRRYRANNLETVRARERENTHRRRALKVGTSKALAEYMAQLVTEPCAYCGSTENITIDHIVPLSRGGEHEPANLAPACYSCNASKNDRLLSEWTGRRAA